MVWVAVGVGVSSKTQLGLRGADENALCGLGACRQGVGVGVGVGVVVGVGVAVGVAVAVGPYLIKALGLEDEGTNGHHLADQA